MEGMQPTFIEVALNDFVKNNPHCQTSLNGNLLLIEKPWGVDDLIIQGEITNQQLLDDLNHIKLNPSYDAIFHIDKNQIEFIFGFLNPQEEVDNSFLHRQFEIIFDGKSYKCFFDKASERLYNIAKNSDRLPTEDNITSVPQLDAFKDIQRLDELPEYIHKFFIGREGRSFYIESENIFSTCLSELARHINFITRYYDRKAPEIVIKNEDDFIKQKITQPKRYIENAFPEALVINPIDEIILKLLEVARSSQPRSAYLYYYQVFEYAGYSYIDEQVKVSLKNILKDPTFINFDDGKISELFSLLTDLNHQDDVKMKKVIEVNCNPNKVWEEISNDIDFFANDIIFDGGLQIKALVSKDTTKDSWKAMWMPKLYDTLTKIRNALVHARERRENKVILPTKSNNEKLRRIIPLIARTAEEIAIKIS